MDANNLVAYLPFDTSTTQDLCGNTWTTYGAPTIENGELQLDGSSNLQCDNISLGTLLNSDCTIHFWMTYRDSKTSEGGFFTTTATGNMSIGWQCYASKARFNAQCTINGSSRWLEIDSVNLSEFKDTRHHFALVRKDDTLYFFFDGTLRKTYTVGTFTSTSNGLYLGRRNNNRTALTMDEFMIHNAALWTQDFTPPTDNDYVALKQTIPIPLKVSFDVERKLANRVRVLLDVERKLKWRYVNAGSANTLITTGTTLTNLDATKSKTGTAFYQTTRAKCFDLPATNEIWIKFDVYFDGSNRWRAYNGGSNGTTGITAQTNGQLSFFSNETNGGDFSGVCKTNQLQTVLLHMISDSSAGVVEAWVDGTKIYTYTGDVNHGEEFADIYLQSDGSGTFFSNVIISNVEVKSGEGFCRLAFDVERRIKNRVQVSFDVQREVLFPIIVPAIGEHFNHLVPSLKIFRDKARKIILPKSSVAYLRAIGTGVIQVYSDTDNDGKFTGRDFYSSGNMYAQLGECETVFVKVSEKPTAVQVIKDFMKSLDETTLSGTAALNEAVNFATGGLFESNAALISSFLNDLDNSTSYTEFLRDKCGIILGNDDTGAITGWDAGGDTIKTDTSIVPEPIPVEEWVVPRLGSSKTINGLTVYFPSTGADGVLTDAEKHILAGLNSVWIEQSLILVKDSFGIDFNEEGTSVKDIDVEFEDNDNNWLASVSHSASSGKATSLTLTINMHYYEYIIMTSEDGRTSRYATYLDRTLAHEFTHAVMAANINYFSDLPKYLKEGMAELVHGIDDVRRATILSLLTSRQTDLETVLAGGTTSNSQDPYAAGYMLLRYLAKQGQTQNYSLVPYELTIENLMISDGATDSNYNALTDNTRQALYLDVLRTILKSTSLSLDVAIFDVLPVQVSLDVRRSLTATVNVLPVDTGEYFPTNPPTVPAGDTPPDVPHEPTVLPPIDDFAIPMQSTEGVQSFEVRISEGQITPQISFVSTEAFDIEQKVDGQYLDFEYQMRVESRRQQGVLYTYNCCSDLDELIYTQITPPEAEDEEPEWQDQDDDSDDDEEKVEYISVGEFIRELAGAIECPEETKMEDYETSWAKEKGEENEKILNTFINSTYADVFREIFGWSSRIPTKFINVFVQDKKLYVIQREKEENEIDITDTKHTTPIFNQELVRTVWSSSPNNKTEVRSLNLIVPNSDDDEEERATIQDQSSGRDADGNSWTATTTYHYHTGSTAHTDDSKENKLKGQLSKIDIVKNYSSGDITSEVTQISYSYDDDGTRTASETSVNYSGKNPPPNTKSVNELKYITLSNGEKFLSQEITERYEDNELVDATHTVHSPSRLGQSSSVRITGTSVFEGVSGQNTGNDSPTPYRTVKSKQLTETLSSRKQTRTINGWTDFDTSFPISDEVFLDKLKEEIEKLNRSTKETVSLTIYNYPHLINLTDKIFFEGKQYFLVSNVARTTPRIKSEQAITMVRWIKKE